MAKAAEMFDQGFVILEKSRMAAQNSLAELKTAESLTFDFMGHSLRVTMRGDEPWFVASDVCEAVGVQNVTQAVARLDEDERSMFNIGRQGEVLIINESGLYSLTLTSRKAQAKKFKKWITSEVLPSIRKNGSYGMPELQNPVMRMVVHTAYQLDRLEREQRHQASLLQTAVAQITTVDTRVAAIEEKVGAQDTKYFTVLGYAKLVGQRDLPTKTAQALGVAASKLSDKLGVAKTRIPDGRYGDVGGYHVSVLEQVFAAQAS